MSPDIYAAAQDYAYQCNESLSGLVERLLRQAMSTQPAVTVSGNFNALAVGDHAKATVHEKKQK